MSILSERVVDVTIHQGNTHDRIGGFDPSLPISMSFSRPPFVPPPFESAADFGMDYIFLKVIERLMLTYALKKRDFNYSGGVLYVRNGFRKKLQSCSAFAASNIAIKVEYVSLTKISGIKRLESKMRAKMESEEYPW